MFVRFILASLLFVISPFSLLRGQADPTSTVGWYNGDWHSGIPGLANWYVSEQQFARVYDDFVVPDSGWIVTSVFSNNNIVATKNVMQASWEIRSWVTAGNGGYLIASGVSSATQTRNPANGVSRVQVDGLKVNLPAGRYWLSVTPLVSGSTFLEATLGANAVGDPLGDNGGAYYTNPATNANFIPAETVGTNGAGGVAKDFSQGVLILPVQYPTELSSAAWQYDLAFLAKELPAHHFNPFAFISQPDWQAMVADLNDRIPTISGPEIRTGLQEIVAAVEDPHTDIGWAYPGPFRLLPLSVYWFDDGVYVTGASQPYLNLLGTRLTWIGASDIDEAIAGLTPLIPHMNDAWVKYQIPGKLINADFLFGTGVSSQPDVAHIEAQSPSGDDVSADVQALAQGESPRLLPVYQGNLPLYRQHPDQYYWATTMDAGATVYFQYNRCAEDPRAPWANFRPQLDQLLAAPGAQRLIVDFRNNTGGTTAALNPWITSIVNSRFNAPGRLYVILGRASFSATMVLSMRFHDETAAIFVGEPTGGTPRMFLRAGDFGLPNSGARVSYSNAVNPSNDDASLMPNIRTGLSFQDYMNGSDPALEAILKLPLPVE